MLGTAATISSTPKLLGDARELILEAYQYINEATKMHRGLSRTALLDLAGESLKLANTKVKRVPLVPSISANILFKAIAEASRRLQESR